MEVGKAVVINTVLFCAAVAPFGAVNSMYQCLGETYYLSIRSRGLKALTIKGAPGGGGGGLQT
jgi:hypothetical protein